MFRKLLYTSIAVLLCTSMSLAATETRIALVIGNGAYQDAPLANTVNDAKLVAESLRGLGFDVLERLELDQKSMKVAIQDFGDRLEAGGKDAVGLVYYAGHGIQVDGVNYLVPVNAAINRERDVNIEAVSTTALMGTLEYARNRLNFIILDACRNNPFAARSFRSYNRGLARMDAPRGTLVAYATAPGDVAADGQGDHSPYTAALAEAIQHPGIPVEQMFKFVRRDVMAATNNDQVPWEVSSLTGDFYFKSPPESDQQAPLRPVTQSEIDREALFWQSIEDSENADDYKEYLHHFPSGMFASLARNRIEAIAGPEALPEPEGQPPAAEEPVDQAESTTEPAEAKPSGEQPSGEQPSGEQPAAGAKVVDAQTRIYRLYRGAEKENNNQISAATAIAPHSQIRAQIEPKGDVDWYRVHVPEQGELSVKIDQMDPEMDVVFRVWNREYSAITSWYAPKRAGGETIGIVDLPAPGNYFLEVRDSHNNFGSSQAFNMGLVFTPTNDRYEPNNSIGGSAQITQNQTWRATMLPKGDVDWYRVHVDHHGELSLEVTDVADNLDVVFRVWNAENHAISGWFAPLKAGGDTVASFDLPAPGDYFLEVRDSHNDNRSAAPFTMKLSYIPSRDGFEANNSFGNATALAIGESIEGTILPKGDVDWYRVGVDEQGELKVAITDVNKDLDMVFRLWNTERHAITGWYAPLSAGGDTNAIIDLAAAGDYLLEVRDSHNDARSIDPYGMKLTFTPSRDRSEPNNSFGSASPLKLGAHIWGTILPKGDADWYRISTVRSGDLNLYIDNSPENLDMVFRVWDSNKHAISGWMAPLRKGGDTEGKVGLPAPGEYYVEVRDSHNDERAVARYRLRASM